MDKRIIEKLAKERSSFDEAMKKKYKEEKELEEMIKKEQKEILKKAEMKFETLGALKRKKFYNDRIDSIVKNLDKINRIDISGLTEEQIARLNTFNNALRDTLRDTLNRIDYKLSKKRLNDIKRLLE